MVHEILHDARILRDDPNAQWLHGSRPPAAPIADRALRATRRYERHQG